MIPVAVVVLDRNKRWSIKDLSDYDFSCVIEALDEAGERRHGQGHGERHDQLARLCGAAEEGRKYGQHVTKEEEA